jgi:uncharacterized protein (TIGR04222 family)
VSAQAQDQNLLRSLAALRKAEEGEALRAQGTAESLRLAIKKYEEALLLWRAIGHSDGEATTLMLVGVTYQSLSEWRKALEFYTQALPLLQAAGDRRGKAVALLSIGLVYNSLNEKQKALDFYNQALPIQREVGDRIGEARTLASLGLFYTSLGELQKAFDFYTKALELLRAVGDRNGVAVTLNKVGDLFYLLGENQRALDFYNQTLPLYRAIGFRIFAIAILRRRRESGPAPKIDLGDPYLIAYLRGGENEALRVEVISLVDRGMLVMDGKFIRRADNVTDGMVEHQVEREALKRFSAPDKAASVFNDYNLKSALQSYRRKLEEAGLLPDGDASSGRWMRFLFALMALLIVGLIKINIGLSLEKPVVILVFMMIAATIIAAVCSFPRLTVRGNAMLMDITNLYSGLRTRVNSFSPGGASAELAMFVAVFGIGALASTPFGYAQTLFPQATSGTSCGSSDGGGGCGGGCGGCGGCGG